VHDAKDLFCCLLIVRHLHGKQALVGDDIEEEACGDPGADAHLPRLENDVALAGTRFVLLLGGVRLEFFDPAVLCPDRQPFADQLCTSDRTFADLLSVSE
jgi:hypothetical protein